MRVTKSVLLDILAFTVRQLRRTRLSRSAPLYRIFAAFSVWLHGSSEAQVGPFRVRFDPRDRVIAGEIVLYGEWEKPEIKVLCSLVKTGDEILDIGANIGLYSLHLSCAVGPEGRVVAVEPDPDNLTLLRANLEMNACRNVTVLPCAFGVESGSVDLFQDERNRGRLSLANHGGMERSVRVPMRRGADVLTELGCQPTIVKMDVEGAEPLVLAGLGYKPDILLFEFTPRWLRSLGHDPEAFLDSLVVQGYKLELIDPDTGVRTPGTPYEITQFRDEVTADWDHSVLATL